MDEEYIITDTMNDNLMRKLKSNFIKLSAAFLFSFASYYLPSYANAISHENTDIVDDSSRFDLSTSLIHSSSSLEKTIKNLERDDLIFGNQFFDLNYRINLDEQSIYTRSEIFSNKINIGLQSEITSITPSFDTFCATNIEINIDDFPFTYGTKYNLLIQDSKSEPMMSFDIFVKYSF